MSALSSAGPSRPAPLRPDHAAAPAKNGAKNTHGPSRPAPPRPDKAAAANSAIVPKAAAVLTTAGAPKPKTLAERAALIAAKEPYTLSSQTESTLVALAQEFQNDGKISRPEVIKDICMIQRQKFLEKKKTLLGAQDKLYIALVFILSPLSISSLLPLKNLSKTVANDEKK